MPKAGGLVLGSEQQPLLKPLLHQPSNSANVKLGKPHKKGEGGSGGGGSTSTGSSSTSTSM
jgi:hypothetical protein